VSPDRRLRASELLGPRIEVLRAGLLRLEDGEEEGYGTVRRMGRAFQGWARGEGLKEVEEAASLVGGAEERKLLKFGRKLLDLLEEVLAGVESEEGQPHTILVVEDNPDDLLLVQVGLTSPDRNLIAASTLAEAERAFEEREIALLVLDLRLPDGDGRSLISDLRENQEYEDLTILVVSGSEDAGMEAECLALGANALFRKPIDPTALAAAAGRALHREARRRSDAQSDALTNLLNRTAIRGLWERWTFPDPSSVGAIGIDGFQALEERFDHEVADSVIASVGRLVGHSAPRGCIGARWEESTFLIFCPGFDRRSATDLLGEVLREIRELDHEDPKKETFKVTASGGVVEISPGLGFHDAVDQANALLEAAMESGGNTLAEAAKPDQPITVLVAEDDPLSAEILIHRLEREGFRVLHYLDGSQALEGALSDQIDCAILDVKMPGMDGFELLERLRKVPNYYELPIMMLTSMGREEDIAKGFELGADDYMVKPFSPVEVLARLRRLLKV
jgi:diguanylate cyclase (GGDEF)-like protein